MEIKEYVAKRKEELKSFFAGKKDVPFLTIVSVGDDPASAAYVKGKTKDLAEVGFGYELLRLPATASEEEVLSILKIKDEDPAVSGILVQLPLPKQIRESAINKTIVPEKDVDGFTPLSPYDSCTPKGIVMYLTAIGFPFRGKNAIVIGRSQIVGKPMAKLLLAKGCNVTVLHSRTSRQDMEFYLKHADLVVVAVGKEGFLDSSYPINENAVVVDVGINRGKDGHLHGDCCPNLKVSLQTPVPGGVGLLTRLALLENLKETKE